MIEKMRKKEMKKKEIKKMKVKDKKMKDKKIKMLFSRHIRRLFCYIFVFYGPFLIFLLTLPL